MWLNQLFIENPIDFEKRCRNRIVFGICFILLGAAAIGLSFAVRNRAMVMYLEQGYRDFMPEFYGGTGFGLAASGVIPAVRFAVPAGKMEIGTLVETEFTDRKIVIGGGNCYALGD